jgi:cytochrome P450
VPETVKLPPGPSYPRLLQTICWVLRPTAFLEHCRKRYGDVFTLEIAREKAWVLVSDPNAIREVFIGDTTILHAGKGNTLLLPILGSRSVVLLDDEAHLNTRKLILPPFHGVRMQRYGDMMREIVGREIKQWPAGEPFALLPRMRVITLEVIMRAVFGIESEIDLQHMRVLLSNLYTASKRWRALLGMVLLGNASIRLVRSLQRALASVDNALLDHISMRRRDPALAERDDVLSQLLQARYDDGAPMTDKELRDQLVTLLWAGHTTTATSLTWVIERLVRHPDKLEKLRTNVAQGDHVYADAIVKETLRLRPIIPIVVRRLVKPMEIAGWSLPAGVSVVPCIYLVHHRPDLYPDPDLFEPERFLHSRPGANTWIPFGGGTHRCIGASFASFQMRLVLETLVTQRQLRTETSQGESVSSRLVIWSPHLGGRIVLEPRTLAS